MSEFHQAPFPNPVRTVRDLEKRVEYWHTHDTNQTLREFLGISQEEYKLWLTEGDDALLEHRRRTASGAKPQKIRVLCQHCHMPMVYLSVGTFHCPSCGKQTVLSHTAGIRYAFGEQRL